MAMLFSGISKPRTLAAAHQRRRPGLIKASIQSLLPLQTPPETTSCNLGGLWPVGKGGPVHSGKRRQHRDSLRLPQTPPARGSMLEVPPGDPSVIPPLDTGLIKLLIPILFFFT